MVFLFRYEQMFYSLDRFIQMCITICKFPMAVCCVRTCTFKLWFLSCAGGFDCQTDSISGYSLDSPWRSRVLGVLGVVKCIGRLSSLFTLCSSQLVARHGRQILVLDDHGDACETHIAFDTDSFSALRTTKAANHIGRPECYLTSLATDHAEP